MTEHDMAVKFLARFDASSSPRLDGTSVRSQSGTVTVKKQPSPDDGIVVSVITADGKIFTYHSSYGHTHEEFVAFVVDDVKGRAIGFPFKKEK